MTVLLHVCQILFGMSLMILVECDGGINYAKKLAKK